MDLPTSPQVPSGPMTRARARALETEVTSLLSELPFDSGETWLIPQAEVLCVIRYEEDRLGNARNEDQVGKYMEERARGGRPLKSFSGRTSGP